MKKLMGGKTVEYFIKEIEKDTKYIGVKYQGEIKRFQEVDLPELWNEFTEKLYNCGSDKLTDKKEAIGYIQTHGEAYTYFAACEVTEFENLEGFHNIEIPKGKYVFHKIKFKNKSIELDRILNEKLPSLSEEIEINKDFAFEFYPEEFDYKDEETSLYFVVQVR